MVSLSLTSTSKKKRDFSFPEISLVLICKSYKKDFLSGFLTHIAVPYRCNCVMKLLVEKMVLDFDFGVGFKVIREKHNRDGNLV